MDILGRQRTRLKIFVTITTEGFQSYTDLNNFNGGIPVNIADVKNLVLRSVVMFKFCGSSLELV